MYLDTPLATLPSSLRRCITTRGRDRMLMSLAAVKRTLVSSSAAKCFCVRAFSSDSIAESGRPKRRLLAGSRPLSPRVAEAARRVVADREANLRPSFHTREFPSGLVDYRSEEGRARLGRVLAEGGQHYLNLMSCYQSQADPSYCVSNFQTNSTTVTF